MKQEKDINCVVRGCRNSSDQGEFIGYFCLPCYETATTGEGVHSTVYKNMENIIKSSPPPHKKFYFAVFEVTSSGFAITIRSKNISQKMIDKHPIQYQFDMNELIDTERHSLTSGKRRENWKVLNWKEVSFDEYNEFNGCL